MVNKLSRELENPIDNIIYDKIENDLEFLKSLNFTPNILTTFSLITALLCIYNFYKDKFVIASLLWVVSYYFDCADGKFARKYNMVSKFGDYYDHGSDLIKGILLTYVIYVKTHPNVKKDIEKKDIEKKDIEKKDIEKEDIEKENKKIYNKFWLIIIFFTIILILLMIFMSCQEIIYGKNESPLLHLFNIKNCDKKIKYLKYFGAGTVNFLVFLMILLWNYF